MQVTTSEIGKFTLQENINFLKESWTFKEIDSFLEDVENLITELKEGRYKKYPKFSKNIHSVLIGNRHVRVFFRIDKNQITLEMS